MSTDQQTAGRIHAITHRVTGAALRYPHPRAWDVCFAGAMALLVLFFVSVAWLFYKGVGVWGNNIPVNWSLAISNYIWFLGVGHAGTLISALLLLVNQGRRNELNRFAETMTLFSVVCAGLYPVLHLGRPWLFYWMAPYPNSMGIWPQFKSPLAWDFFAVLTYLLVSVVFWYIGLLPDLGIMRDRAKKRWQQVLYGIFALGWRGSARHWARWETAYRLSAAIAVALVVSVTAEYSLIFAAGPVPGWNSTIYPPYFLMGAVFSGFAVVSMITAVLRPSLDISDLVTDRHLDLLGKLTLACGLMTAYGYVAEAFTALYSADKFEIQTLADRVSGSHSFSYWGAIVCNFVPLQLLWFRAVRTSPLALFAIGLSVTVGMWLERYMLLATSLYRDYLISSWGGYAPSLWEWLLFAGMLGVFFVPFLLFVRFLPMMSTFEVARRIYNEDDREAHHA